MEPFKLFEDLWLVDLAIYLPGQGTLVIADPHLGYGEALRRDGVLLPSGHLWKVEERLAEILERLGPPERPRLVINGDLKHRFAPLSRREWHEAHGFLDFLTKRFDEVLLLRGNHDTNIDYLAEQHRGLKIQDFLQEDGILLIHGDRQLNRRELDGVKLILIGHEHPAVGLQSRASGRIEIYKAFLLGEYRDRKLLVQPSFNLLLAGGDLAQERAISPLISEDQVKKFQVYPVSDEGEIYAFGPLGPLLRPSLDPLPPTVI